MTSKVTGLSLFLCVLVTLLTFLISSPATYWQPIVKQLTHDSIRLVNVTGSLMSGSGQIAYTVGPNRWQVLAERTNWHITPTLYGLRLSVEDNSHRLFVRPLTVLFTPQNISIGEGESEFPITLLQVFGGLTRTLKLSGQMRAIWHPVTLSLLTYQIKAPFDFEVTMNNLHSVVSPLPQLGSYKISGVLSQLNGHFEVTTLTGPLHIEGQGVAVGRVIQFNGQAQADVGMEDQLMGLLLLMGNMNGRVAHLHY